MEIPIKFALLWHQHQPYYKSGGVYRLPWVRLHCTKDYLEMAQHLRQTPAMHATINLVPSLLEQIQDYENGAEDILLQLCRRPVSELNDSERDYITKYCLMANKERVIARSGRYTELAQQHKRLTDQELIDLIVLFSLGWSGEFERDKESLALLISQDRDYTEAQKNLLLDEHEKIVASVIEAHKALLHSGSIELSTTPFYHPILPLLCNTNSATEAVSDAVLPKIQFASVEDASEQLSTAISNHSRLFGQSPTGVWPAEGSISDEALRIIADSGIVWTASDETVLLNSLLHSDNNNIANEYGAYEKYFPRTITSGDQTLTLFFRDHHLSDKIGFDYQRWQATDAVADLIAHCKYVRSEMLLHYGEEVLKNACISVILDGENCWEYYERNGFEFLSQLYAALVDEQEIDTVTFSEALEHIGLENIRPINHIVAGSWINANFKIWIGHPEKNHAWELLAATKKALEEVKETIEVEAYRQAQSALLKAEGSDWFWWFGDDHSSEDRLIFDELFRAHLQTVYALIKVAAPEELFLPIIKQETTGQYSSMHRTS